MNSNKTNTQNDLNALKRFIKAKERLLTDIARFNKATKDQVNALDTLTTTTRKIIELDRISKLKKEKSLQ